MTRLMLLFVALIRSFLFSFSESADSQSLPMPLCSLILIRVESCFVVQWLSRVLTLCNPIDFQHPRFPCPSPSPRVWSNSCPSSQWCYRTISSSAIFSFCRQSFPASGSSMSRLFASGGQSTAASTSASVFPMNNRIWFLSGLTGLVSLQSKESQESSTAQSFETSILQCSAFFMVQLSQHYMTAGKTMALIIQTFVSKVMPLLFNMMARFVIVFLPRSRHLLISFFNHHHQQWFWSPRK